MTTPSTPTPLATPRANSKVRPPVVPTIYTDVGGIVSYPRPARRVGLNDVVVTPRPLLGLLPPPVEAAPPPPRTRAPLPPPPPGWVSTYHAAPAAYPRTLRESHGTLGRDSYPWGAEPPRADETPAQKERRVRYEHDRVVRGRYDAEAWSLADAVAAAPPKQWLSVERWRRTTPRGGHVLVCTHAGGFQKEVGRGLPEGNTLLTRQHWHEVLRDVITRDPEAPAGRFGGGALTHPHHGAIDEVWMMDDLHHNGSVALSDGRLGPVQTWEDTGRDLLNLVAHVVPAVRRGAEAPWDLPWAGDAEAWARGPRPRVLALGHSFGGCAIIHAARARPELFDGVLLVDPVPLPTYTPRSVGYADTVKPFPVTPVVLRRRGVWPSAAEARRLLRPSPFFSPWTAAQFDVYMARAIEPADPAMPDGPVTLATPIWAEACVFTEPDAGARAWDKLPLLQVPTGFVMAGNSSTTQGDETSQQMVWRPPRARNERYLQAGHLLTQEDPQLVAESLWRFLCTLSAGEWDAGGTGPAEANL